MFLEKAMGLRGTSHWLLINNIQWLRELRKLNIRKDAEFCLKWDPLQQNILRIIVASYKDDWQRNRKTVFSWAPGVLGGSIILVIKVYGEESATQWGLAFSRHAPLRIKELNSVQLNLRPLLLLMKARSTPFCPLDRQWQRSPAAAANISPFKTCNTQGDLCKRSFMELRDSISCKI